MTASNMLFARISLETKAHRQESLLMNSDSLMSVESYTGIPDDDYLACMTGYLHPGPEGLRLDLHNSSKV